MNRIYCFLMFLLISSLTFAQEYEPVNLTSPEAFELMQKHRSDSNFVILDLRTKAMFDEEHIENAIVYDVFSEGFDNWVNKLDKQKTYLLYCTRGHRSGIALEKMKQGGFVNLLHLYQGINEWRTQGFKTIKKTNNNT